MIIIFICTVCGESFHGSPTVPNRLVCPDCKDMKNYFLGTSSGECAVRLAEQYGYQPIESGLETLPPPKAE